MNVLPIGRHLDSERVFGERENGILPFIVIRIAPCGKTTVLRRLGELGGEASSLLESINDDGQWTSAAEWHSVELGYAEIAEEEVELALGYAGITKFNGPIGVPLEIAPRTVGPEFLFFSTFGLAAHLHGVAGEVIAEIKRVGSFKALIENQEIGAFEYLVGALWECSLWCEMQKAALSIRW